MGIENLLSRLSHVKPGSAPGRWNARCPAHEDKSPSLTIRGEDSGVTLLHCFAGCEPDAILGALGLSFSELFPERLSHRLPKTYAAFSPLDALKCLTEESAVVAIAASDIALGKTLSDADASRVCVAAGRIATALEVVHG